jgi:glycosyltransferase involved in cell wall biosynthesis
VVKIAFILTQSLDSPSGLGRYFPLSKELAKFNHQVTVFALHPNFEEISQKSFQTDGVFVNYVSQMHVMKPGDVKRYYSPWKLLWITLKASWRLTGAVIRSNPDLVIIGKPHPMNGVAGLMTRLFRRCQIFLDCDDYEAGSGRFSSGFQRSLVAAFEKWLPKHVNRIFTNTNFMIEKLVEWGVQAEKIIYLPNGVDSSRFPPPDDEKLDMLREAIGLNNEKVIGFIGSLSLPSHPVDLLIDAFHQLRTEFPDVRLLLVGGGEDLPTLREQAGRSDSANSILFTGRVEPEQIPFYYAMLDVSVDPVRDNQAARGRSPLKLFESWYSDTPFVTSDVGDRRMLLGDPQAGVLVEPGNPVSLAEGIRSIIANPAYADELCRRGKVRVKSYTWDQLALRVNQEIQAASRVLHHD